MPCPGLGLLPPDRVGIETLVLRSRGEEGDNFVLVSVLLVIRLGERRLKTLVALRNFCSRVARKAGAVQEFLFAGRRRR